MMLRNLNTVLLQIIIIGVSISLGFALAYGLQIDPPGDLGGTDPYCDYNEGTKNSEGLSTCDTDYKTKVHGDQGKTIDARCENGYVVGAEMVSSDDDCFEHMEDNEQNFANCAATQVEETCGWKWQNWCASTHHITTKSITCAPL